MIVDNELYLLRKVWATASTPLWKDTVWYHHSTHTYVLSSIAVGTAGRMFWHLIFLWQSESYRLPLGLLYVYFVSIQPTIPVPSWLVCHLQTISKNGAKFASLLVIRRLQSFPYQRLFPWTPLGTKPQFIVHVHYITACNIIMTSGLHGWR